MLHLSFRRLPACLCGLVARHCPDNGARKQALWAQRLFGWQRCHRIVPARPRTPGACLLRLGRGTRTALLHLPGRPAPRLTRRDGAVVPRASGEQISTVGSDPGTWETRWPEVCRGWFVCSGIPRQRQGSRRPRHGHGHLCLMQARRGQRGPFSLTPRQFGRAVTPSARRLGRSQFLIVMVTPELEAVPAELVATDVKV
jgi:hypothetical protein